MTNEVLSTIMKRRSIRDFSQKKLEKEALEAIVTAGQYAPNGGGESWHFTVIQNTDVSERLNILAKQYASRSGLPWLEELGGSSDFHSIYHAPAVILVSGDEQGIIAKEDTAAATQNMLLAAESIGIGSCWGYFLTQAFLTEEGRAMKSELGIPDNYQVFTSVMLGYLRGEHPDAPKRKAGTVTFIC